MNIFVTDKCPIQSAKFLDDRRVIKMILESAQLLSTAMNFYGAKGPYKTTHLNHPCSIWVRSSRANYNWLYEHFMALISEYYQRYNKIHKCYDFHLDFYRNRFKIPDNELTPFINCTTYKNEKNTIKAYQLYLMDKWNKDKIEPTWYKVKR